MIPSYIPAWTEFTISAAVVAGAILIFLFMVERYRVWESRPEDPQAAPLKLPEFDYASSASLLTPTIAARTRFSLVFIGAAALGFAFLSSTSASRQGVLEVPAQAARGGDTLWVDGNLDGYGVAFAHQGHCARIGGAASCANCHHMNIPLDQHSRCAECHRQMYQPAEAFQHDWHASPAGANLQCFDCHQLGNAKTSQTAKPGADCHLGLIPPPAKITIDSYQALSYVEAMHQLCISCHSQKSLELDKPDLARCAQCHHDSGSPTPTTFVSRRREPNRNHPMVPQNPFPGTTRADDPKASRELNLESHL